MTQHNADERPRLFELLRPACGPARAPQLIARHRPEDAVYLEITGDCAELLGYRCEELIGRSPLELAHPQERTGLIAELGRIRDSLAATKHNCRLRRADGLYATLEVIAYAIRDPATGEAREIVSSARDVTREVLAEQRLLLLQSAVDQIEEAVLITDADLDPPGPRIVFANPAFERMTGYRLDEIVGQNPRVLQGPRTDRAVLDHIRRGLERGQPIRADAINYRKDGTTYHVEWHLAPVRDPGGRIVYWVAIQHDISDRKHAEARAQHRQAELAHVARLSTMGEMASGLAHEINQPLTAIANYARGCLRRSRAGGVEPDQLVETLTHIAAQAERAGEVIRRLRQFVRKREPHRSTAFVEVLIDDTLQLAHHELQQREVHPGVEVPDGLPPLLVDAIQIEQVLLNLVRNALDAVAGLPAAERKIALSASHDGPTHLRLTVRDNGQGVDPAHLDRLFDPFFSTKPTGMGMGLNISQSIVEAHAGRLWSERNPCGGMTFHIRLPIAPAGPSRLSDPEP